MKNKTKKYFKNGVTLVELLIYMALMGIFLVVLMDVFTMTLNSKLSTESTSALEEDSRYIFTKLSYDINNADSITLPATGSSGTTLRIVSGGITSTYASSAGKFVLTQNGATMSLNGLDTDLESLNFTNNSSASGKAVIKIDFTLGSNIVLPGAARTQSVSTTVGSR